MLIIRRRQGESIQIADNIIVQILEISPSRVKLGIEAPCNILVLRQEANYSAEENRRASTSQPLTPGHLTRLQPPDSPR